MSFDESNSECPLCMENFEPDDINFFPCSCGYQICRFCWHRLRTEENGVNGTCPACRKQYSEDPAEFKALTEDEVNQFKKERKEQDSLKKHKTAENRKHLANVRVVQHNLVFVVGLTPKLAEPEVLRKHEYFGKFGKIHKVVINSSSPYSGSQGPTVSAYVTFYKPEDALRAIQQVNNIHIDGRTLKASLGTTKYCSHFLRGANCTKSDCMYLHDLGDNKASFTKEDMQQGRHLDYESQLFEIHHLTKKKQDDKPSVEKDSQQVNGNEIYPTKDIDISNYQHMAKLNLNEFANKEELIPEPKLHETCFKPISPPSSLMNTFNDKPNIVEKDVFNINNNSPSNFERNLQHNELFESEFLTNESNNYQDDELGFDPWLESAKGLADLVKREKIKTVQSIEADNLAELNTSEFPGSHNTQQIQSNGFAPNLNLQLNTSKLLPLMRDSSMNPNKEFEDSFRALLPADINIKFGPQMLSKPDYQNFSYDHVNPNQFADPAIVSAGILRDTRQKPNLINMEQMPMQPPPGFGFNVNNGFQQQLPTMINGRY